MPLSKQQLGSLLWGIADTGHRGIEADFGPENAEPSRRFSFDLSITHN